MVSFTLRQITALVDGPSYQVTNEITAATGADIFTFVYSAASQEFSHYARAADVEQWPTSLALAQVQQTLFYRLSTLVRTWSSVQDMNADLADTTACTQALADELNAQTGSLTIDRTTVITGV